jgi:hypothetical protein
MVASHEAGPDTLAARTELADLIAEAAGGLSDGDLAVLELAYRHGLEGADLAAALEVSVAQARAMSMRLRQTVERSLGALLLARRVRRNPLVCLELARILHGWDGVFTARTRNRVTGHVESCRTCEAERRRLVTPAALLGAPVFIPAPDWLRAQTLRRIRLTSAGHGATPAPRAPRLTVVDNHAVVRRGNRRLIALVGLIAVLAVTALRSSARKSVTKRRSQPSYR